MTASYYKYGMELSMPPHKDPPNYPDYYAHNSINSSNPNNQQDQLEEISQSKNYNTELKTIY